MQSSTLTPRLYSFAAAGAIAVVVAWFMLPEVTRRTPAEIDEMYVESFITTSPPAVALLMRFVI